MGRELFNVIGSGKSFGGGGDRLRDGKGKAVVLKQTYSKTRSGMMFLTEFMVVENSKKVVVSPTSGEVLDVEPNPEGSTFNDTQFLEGVNVETAVSSTRKLMNAILKKNEGDLTPDQMNAACAQATGHENEGELIATYGLQPTRGMLVTFDTYRKKSKGDNGKPAHDYVLPNFGAVAQTPAEVKAMRASLDEMATAVPG